MEVRAKKSLGQHFLVDQNVARRIVDSLGGGLPALEIGPGMGVLTQYLLQRDDIDLKLVELDGESVDYLLTHFNGMQGRLFQADYLKLDIHRLFPGQYNIIGNFPYNISSQIFFKILDDRDLVPEVVCMVQKEVAERIAEGPGSKTYGHQIPYTPFHSGSAAVNFETPWFTVGYTIIASGIRYALGQNIPANQLDPYADQSIFISHDFNIKDKVTLGFKAEMLNLANAQYEIVRNYPMQGRSFRIKLMLRY